eukprot:Gregarina_sp_Poly_1__3462@NODE_2002_length_2884_cov_124_605609_g1293_i0_p1_GENE_NODE_2002_length_2884_cov_124_605609_g1293_i0NODE_2002_length_2884_cov_124_605609_g1293_i0_p1_ORF_typecomplete_len664_score90_02_NODE_2002_length_2884_cov_124_605609_g1293_i06002591
MEPVRRPQPLHSKLLGQQTPHSKQFPDTSRCASKRIHKPPNEDIPRPVPPLPLNRVVGFDPSATPGAARNSSMSSVTSSAARPDVSPSIWQSHGCPSGSSAITRSSLAYSIIHHRSASNTSWATTKDKDPPVSTVVSPGSRASTRQRNPRRPEKRNDCVPSPSLTMSRHSASRGSVRNTGQSIFNVPKPFWLQSLVSSEASEEETEMGERKVTECGPLLFPSLPVPAETDPLSDIESAPEDTLSTVRHIPPSRSRRDSVMTGRRNGDGEEGVLIRRLAASPVSSRPSFDTPLAGSRSGPKLMRGATANLGRRNSAVAPSPSLSPSLEASIPKYPATARPSGADRRLRPQETCRLGNSFASASPRCSVPTFKSRPTLKPSPFGSGFTASVSRRVGDRVPSQETPSPRRSSASLPRAKEDWPPPRGGSDSDKFAGLLARLSDKSQQLVATQVSLSQPGTSHGSSSAAGWNTARAAVSVSPEMLAPVHTARLSDASTTDKTFKTTRETTRGAVSSRDCRLSKGLNSQRSGLYLSTRLSDTHSPPRPTESRPTEPRPPGTRPAGEPSILDRVNSRAFPHKQGARRRVPAETPSTSVSAPRCHSARRNCLAETETSTRQAVRRPSFGKSHQNGRRRLSSCRRISSTRFQRQPRNSGTDSKRDSTPIFT